MPPGPRRLAASYMEAFFDGLSGDVCAEGFVRLALPGRLSGSRLETALAEVARRHPVVGARYRRRVFRSHWEVDPEMSWVVDEQSAVGRDGARAVEEASIEVSPDQAARVPLQLRLVHTEDHDLILLRFSRLLADGGGVRNLLYDLAEATRRAGGEPPAWNRGIPRTPRRAWAVLSACARTSRLGSLGRLGPDVCALWPRRGFLIPMAEGPPCRGRLAELSLSAARLTALKDRWSGHGVTINDLLLAAFTRAMEACYRAAMRPDEPLLISIAADLRQHLPPDGRVDNFSTMQSLVLGRVPLPSPHEHARNVSAITARWKGRGAGLGLALAAMSMLRATPDAVIRSVCRRQSRQTWGRIVLTNTGVWDRHRLDFGTGPCLAARVANGPALPPTLITGATTCAGILTFWISYLEPALSRRAVDALLASLDRELGRLAEPA